MRKFAVAASLCAVASGVAGFILRRSQLLRAFEPDTGLPVAGAQSTISIMCYVAFILMASAAVALYVAKNFTSKQKYSEAFAPTGGVYLTFAGLIAAALIFAGFATYLRHGFSNRPQLLIAALTAVSGACIFGLAYEQYRLRDYKMSLVYAVVPELFLLAWLLVVYRVNQTNPVRMNYAFQALAIAASALGFYFNTSYVFGRRLVARLVYSHSVAVFFLGIALADPVAYEIRVAYVSLALFFCANLFRLAMNLEHKDGNVITAMSAPNALAYDEDTEELDEDEVDSLLRSVIFDEAGGEIDDEEINEEDD